MILVKTTGQSAVGQSVPAVLLGPVVTPEFFPSGGWETCPYFPPVPQDFVAVGRFVLQRSPALAEARGETVLGVTPPALIPGIAVAWYQQVPITHARGPIGDPSLSQLLLRRLQSAAERLRTASAPFFAADAAFQILPEAVGFPAALASRRTDLSAAPDGRAATVFRGLFKRPSADSLKVREDGEPLAIPFEADGIALLDLMTGKATSTELMRFESNRLDLLPTRLVRAQPLEIFHEATDQCSRADVNGSGAKIGRDYTLRLLMEDDDENTYDKTLYVTASTFFLSPDEWAKREAMGLSLIGYRKLANLPEITGVAAQRVCGPDPRSRHGAVTAASDAAGQSARSPRGNLRRVCRQSEKPGPERFRHRGRGRGFRERRRRVLCGGHRPVPCRLACRQVRLGRRFHVFIRRRSLLDGDSDPHQWHQRLRRIFDRQEWFILLGTGNVHIAPRACLRGISARRRVHAGSCSREPSAGKRVRLQSGRLLVVCGGKRGSREALSLYPRSVGGVYCTWGRNLFVVVRYLVGGKIYTDMIPLTAGTPAVPIPIGGGAAIESVVYLCVGREASEVARPFYGAPPGDRLVVRSV